MVAFNSRNKIYKSIISALKTDQQVKFRISVPRTMGCSGASLIVRKENECNVTYNMFWAGMNGNDHEWWELHFSAQTSGLYWYHFELQTPWGVNGITNDGNGVGTFDFSGVDFQLTVYDKNFTTPNWLKGGVIYQIFPDRFYNSRCKKNNVPTDRIMRDDWNGEPYWKPDENGKVLNNDYFCGDLKGIESKLDYICDLGVNCIYLNPIFESHSNHRYDTADYMKIDPLLGDENDLKSLCKKASEKGIKIILDGVFSHTGCDSRYFNKYNRYNELGAYNSKDSKYYSWYKFINWPDDYHSWWGISLLPEVIEEDDNFQQFICGENGVIKKWLKAGIFGWRLDVADELPDCFLDKLRKAVKQENTDAIIIGEVWEDATTKFAYGQRRRYLLGDQLDSVMNYPFADAVLNFVKYGNSHYFINSIMSIIENYPPEVLNVLMNHIGTHDTERAITRLAGENCEGHPREWQTGRNLTTEKYNNGVTLLKMASFIQYTLPGVPSIYYGDEIGMQGYRDPFNRGCFQWNNINSELLRWYRRLGEIRKSCSAFSQGEFVPQYYGENIISFTRESDDSKAFIAVNRNDYETEIDIPSEFLSSYCAIGNVPVNGKIKLGKMGMTLLIK